MRVHSITSIITLLICAIVCLAGRCVNAENPPVIHGALGEQLDDWMWRMEQFGMHGAILVLKDGKIVLKRGYGVADHVAGKPISHETLFDIGSLAKQFTAAAILKLEMQGKLHVDHVISEYLNDVPDDKKAITIHHLLTHTSGLPYHGDSMTKPMDLPLDTPPGEMFHYSNPGYAILADIIESVSGTTFEKFVENDIFTAAGLEHTGFRGRVDAPAALFATSYTDSTAQSSASERTQSDLFRGAGGIVSCVDDLYHWELALTLNTVLSEQAREKFFHEHVRNETDTFGYAYGWMTAQTERGTPVRFHQGNFGGFNAEYRRYPEEGLTIIFLSNHYMSGRSMRDAVTNHISRLVNKSKPELVPQPPQPLALLPDDLQRLTGSYRTANGMLLRVTLAEDGRTFLVSGEGQEALNVLYSPWMTDVDRKFVDHCNIIAKEITEAAFVDDSTPFNEHASPALPNAWLGLQQLSRDLELTLGVFESCETIGTALSGGSGHGQTFVKVQFADGEARIAFTFTPGGVVHFDRVPTDSARVTCGFLAILDDTICHFNIFNSEQTVITFRDNYEFKIVRLEIETGLGETLAAKKIE